MNHRVKPETRLFVETPLIAGASFYLSPAQAHQLQTVQRLKTGDFIAVFNGSDGEWLARLGVERRTVSVELVELRRTQAIEADLWLLCAPIKHGRIDFLIEKSTELGVGRIKPVMTRYTQVARVNIDRLRHTAREAAEQCERLAVPVIDEPGMLTDIISDWKHERRLFVCAETGDAQPIAKALAHATGQPAAFLIGPEGGFSAEELTMLAEKQFITSVGLGPRLLRAETAALAALSCWQALAGEWTNDSARPYADLI